MSHDYRTGGWWLRWQEGAMTIGDRLSGAAVGLFLVVIAVLIYRFRDWLYRIWRMGGSFLCTRCRRGPMT